MLKLLVLGLALLLAGATFEGCSDTSSSAASGASFDSGATFDQATFE